MNIGGFQIIWGLYPIPTVLEALPHHTRGLGASVERRGVWISLESLGLAHQETMSTDFLSTAYMAKRTSDALFEKYRRRGLLAKRYNVNE